MLRLMIILSLLFSLSFYLVSSFLYHSTVGVLYATALKSTENVRLLVLHSSIKKKNKQKEIILINAGMDQVTATN